MLKCILNISIKDFSLNYQENNKEDHKVNYHRKQTKTCKNTIVPTNII